MLIAPPSKVTYHSLVNSQPFSSDDKTQIREISHSHPYADWEEVQRPWCGFGSSALSGSCQREYLGPPGNAVALFEDPDYWRGL